MRVYVIPAQAKCFGHDIKVENTLTILQTLVGGYIEPCAPAQLREWGIELLANEEGLLKGLPFNINMYPFFFVGDLVAVGVKGEEFVSLTPEQEHYLKDWLNDLS